MKIAKTLSLLMFIFVLAACGGKKNSDDNKDGNDTTSTQTEVKPEEKKDALLGEWSLETVNGENQGSMNLLFEKDGHVTITNSGESIKGTYKKTADGNSIIIKTSDVEEDKWDIKSISETELILLDELPDKPNTFNEYVFKR